MRHIERHLRNNWRVPESLEKVTPISRSLHLRLQWWLEESNVLSMSTITPTKTCSADIHRCIKRRVGRSIKRAYCKRNLVPSRKQAAINYLELKAVFLGLKQFQGLCSNKIVLVVTDNTTMVSYIKKEGGMKSGRLCALLWRILTWCARKQVTLKARHITGQLNVVADKLSRLGQTIQTEWSLLPEVFHSICSRDRPQTDLFVTRFNNKLSLFVSPVPDPLASAVDALSLPWKDLDAEDQPDQSMRQSGPCLQSGASLIRWTSGHSL